MRKVINNWEEIIEQHQQSGKTIQEFCKDIGIHPNTFYKHRKKFSRRQVEAGAPEVVEIKPAATSSSGPIILQTKKFMISISNGFDESQLKSVLKVIGELE